MNGRDSDPAPRVDRLADLPDDHREGGGDDPLAPGVIRSHAELAARCDADAARHARRAPELLVYIPTFNRPVSVRTQVHALLAQRADWPGTVRILVSDNASPTFLESELLPGDVGPGVEVRRNPANLGANANIALGFVFAREEEYLWILSDNDTIGPHAIRHIAEEGLRGDCDAIVFTTLTDEPSDFVHEWDSAWDGVQENGLISNVIYRGDVFLPDASAAFFYHNTGFPHLSVLLSALKRRGSLRYRLLPSSRVFAPQQEHGEEPGDYSVSLTGMPQLLPLLPRPQARRLARLWLRDQGVGFFQHRSDHEGNFLATKAILTAWGGGTGRLYLGIARLRTAALRTKRAIYEAGGTAKRLVRPTVESIRGRNRS